jgi:hypothetical protein
MNRGQRRPVPSWRAGEARKFRADLWLAALVVVAILLVEVWQASTMAEVSLRLDRNTKRLTAARARLDYVRAERERFTTRAELDRVARSMGLAPVDAQQLVALPSAYLERGGEGERGPAAPLLAWAERAARSVVPEAMAHTRTTD